MSDAGSFLPKNSENLTNLNSINHESHPKNIADSKNSEHEKLQILVSFHREVTHTAQLTLTGNISQPDVQLLRSATDVCLTEKKLFIILDMSNVNNISSAGWGYLVAENVRLSKIGVKFFLAALKPDLNLLFSDLQLDHVIKSFPTIKECKNAIELIKQKESKKPETDQLITEQLPVSSAQVPQALQASHPDHQSTSQVSLPEKIISIIAKYGPSSFLEILTILRSEEFITTKIGFFQLQKTLSRMNLESFSKRERYFRSC